jgi:enterochelin esterase-like enzyme
MSRYLNFPKQQFLGSCREYAHQLARLFVLMSFSFFAILSACVRDDEIPNLPSEEPLSIFTELPPTATASPPLPSTPTRTSKKSHIPTLPASLTKQAMKPVERPTTTIVAKCLDDNGRIELNSLRSDRLKLPMEYRVWLPPCYEKSPEQRYPVLYMIHGQNYNEDQWDRLGIDETAAKMITSGEIPPLIIVMPRDRNWGQPSEDLFGRVLVEELVPMIDATYRTEVDRSHRAVGGLSRGAGWAVHLGLRDWQLFGTLGAHSLPVFWEDTSHLHRWLEEIPAESFPRIYLDIGDHDRPEILASARWFEGLLTKRNIPHEWYLFPGYHEEKYWQDNLVTYLRWYSAGWDKT